jgi:putative transposase
LDSTLRLNQKIRRVHAPAFKAKVALEAIKEQKTIAELSSIYKVHTTQITKWKRLALDILAQDLSQRIKQRERDDQELIQELYQQIGRLKVEVDFLKKRWASLANNNHLRPKDIALHIDKADSVLPVGKQAELLGIARSSLYYQPKPVPDKTLLIMNAIDEVYTARPFYGSRRIAGDVSDLTGEEVNRKRIQRLMREMCIEAIYPKPNLSKNNKAHPVYPYLLKGITAGFPNHIWGTDITYIRMHKGYLYLTAYMDWYSRFILSWRLSTTLDNGFVFRAVQCSLNEASYRVSRKPEEASCCC